jgi:hypothetical protein
MYNEDNKSRALELIPGWLSSSTDQIKDVKLLGIDDALDQSWIRRGISRKEFLAELLKSINHREALPILAMLPRGWKAKPAMVPEKLRGMATILEEELMTPKLLGALADELNHLWPAKKGQKGESALTRWSKRTIRYQGNDIQLPTSMEKINEVAENTDIELTTEQNKVKRTRDTWSAGIGIKWENTGMRYSQTKEQRLKNMILAQVLNALASNQLNNEQKYLGGSEHFIFEGQQSTHDLVKTLASNGWKCKGRFRSSVASFGRGASCPDAENPKQWEQIPLALPYRTGILYKNNEITALFPHSSFELELESPNRKDNFLVQYYQGTEGLNGWAALNDLHRPWQNDRKNGTVRYSDIELSIEKLLEALDISDVIARIHNSQSSHINLRYGGYGTIGFCIDSTGLLEYAISGNTNQFPLTLNGIWRERLENFAKQINETTKNQLDRTHTAIERYQVALEKLPCDIDIRISEKDEALRRLCKSQPSRSPFKTIEKIKTIESETANGEQIL